VDGSAPAANPVGCSDLGRSSIPGVIRKSVPRHHRAARPGLHEAVRWRNAPGAAARGRRRQMQARILLAIIAAALAPGPNQRAESNVTGLTSSAVESGSPNNAAQLEGTEWSINAPIPEPLGVAQGATVASADGSLIYHIGGITGDMTASNRVWVYS